MNWPLIIGVTCITFSVLYVISSWRLNVERTRELDRIGKVYGVGRWEDEPNDHYQERIYDRISITGGKRNPW